MLSAVDERELADLSALDTRTELTAAIRRIRTELNPNSSGQRKLNMPWSDGIPLLGPQHKYRETVLYFPRHGQTCHTYCTYCFRWVQFIGDADLRFAAPGPEVLLGYLRTQPDVTDVLVTGGDPLVMSTARLRNHLMPLLTVETVRTIRIGTKSITANLGRRLCGSPCGPPGEA